MEHHGSLLSVGANWSGPSFEDQELVVTGWHDPPYTLIHDHPNGTTSLSGYLFDIWTIVARELKLRYRIQPPRTPGFGSLDANLTWTGLVGELAYKRADVALTWLYWREDRALVVDYIDTVPVEQNQYTFYVRKGRGGMPPLSVGMFGALLSPLGDQVWWMLLVSLLVLSVGLRLSLRCNHRAEKKRTVEEMTWGSCVFSCFMSVVGQGWAYTPHSLAARTVTTFCWVLRIIIYVNYTANLISNLTTVTVDRPISGIKEFTEQSNWRFALEPGVGELNEWKLSRKPYERELYRRSVVKDRFVSLDLSGPSAAEAVKPNVLTYADINRLFFSLGSKACCLVPLLDTPPPKRNSYMIIAKNMDKIRRAISHVMLTLYKVGIISRLKRKWVPAVQGMCETSPSVRQMSFQDLLAVLVVPPLAVALSGAIFIGELTWHWRGRRQPSRLLK